MATARAVMLRGWDTGLVVDDELMAGDVYAAHDAGDRRYLLAHTAGATWLCAPISERALECVASGRAELRAVFAHSATGLVEKLSVRNGVVWDSALVPCDHLEDAALPRPGVRLCWGACA